MKDKLLISLALFLVACSLDKGAYGEFDSSSIAANERNALAALTGIYRGNITYNLPEYTPSDWWSYGGLLFLELPTDNAYDRRGENSNFHRLTDGTLFSDNSIIESYWKNSYAKIVRVNNFLEDIQQLSDDSKLKSRFIAEARFLRATQYFYLSQFFGGVPLIRVKMSLDEANSTPKSSKERVEEFVETELLESVKDLPYLRDMPASEMGRVSRQAALAFLGRLYLGQYRFEAAIDVYEAIVDFGDNELLADYSSVFLPQNKQNRETIFAVQYLAGRLGAGLPQHTFPVKDGGWCLINATASLFESYEFIDGSLFSYEDIRYNPKNLGEGRDPRLDYTLYYDGTMFRHGKYECHPDYPTSRDCIDTGQTTQTGFMLRKYLDEDAKYNLNSYGANIPVIRYAEVLLSLLEAKLEAGMPISQALLDATINKVRGRASVQMPPITETNATILREIVRRERRVELAMEGIRYWDLLRWKTAHIELNAPIFGAPYPDAVRMKVPPHGERDSNSRWYVGIRKFRKEKDYNWPIPLHDQLINPELKTTNINY